MSWCDDQFEALRETAMDVHQASERVRWLRKTRLFDADRSEQEREENGRILSLSYAYEQVLRDISERFWREAEGGSPFNEKFKRMLESDVVHPNLQKAVDRHGNK